MKKLAYTIAALLCLSACEHSDDAPQVGTQAPTFTLPSQDGKNISLADYRGKWVVLYFYPKDFTHGCTIEAHNFQQDIAKYHARNAVIVGVSVDSVDSHKGFCTKQGLDFKLLSDAGHDVSKSYGTLMALGMAARTTYLIDPQGVIRKAYTNVDPSGHSHQVLADIDSLQPGKKQK